MLKLPVSAVIALLSLGGFAVAQNQPQNYPAPNYPSPEYQAQAPSYPAPNYPPPPPNRTANQLTPQVLGEMLRTASTFHQLVESMNLNHSLGPDQHVLGPDGQYHHDVQRTAATIGAGAGAGAAIGAMTRSPNGVMIGALIGSAGGLIVDQIMRHQEDARAKASYANQQNGPYPSFQDLQRGNDPRNGDPNYYQHDLRQFKQRDPNGN